MLFDITIVRILREKMLADCLWNKVQLGAPPLLSELGLCNGVFDLRAFLVLVSWKGCGAAGWLLRGSAGVAGGYLRLFG